MRRLSILFLAFVLFLPIFGQNEEKYSHSTQLFLLEQAGKVNLNKRVPRRDAKGQIIGNENRRTIASPETVDGVLCISAYIRLDDNSDVSDLEALGVKIETKFADGLVTAQIPVDKIEEVAAIARVKRINVASIMRPLTDQGRIKTNTDDVLTYSTSARAAGLPNAYDGSGVLLGIIDTGIDFQHIAFKDKNGGYRAVGAYQVKSNGAREFTQATMADATYDTNSEDHGTHTSSTAGGSSVIINGSSVTVTDDHGSATYGGMAPGADLYLAGMYSLLNTYLSNSFSKIIACAEAHDNMPVVISNSWGSGSGPRDGTDDFATTVSQYFNDNHPNRVCLFASSNDAGSGASNGGGFHVYGTAVSASNPLGTIINDIYNNANQVNGKVYDGTIAVIWARSNTTLKCKVYVINSSTGALLATSNEVTSGSVSGLSSYYSGTLRVTTDTQNGKTGMNLEASNFTAKGSYRIAIEVYPSSGSAYIDMWGGDYYQWFSADVSTSGHTWTNGTDDMSVSDEATIPNAISVGAYVTKKSWTDYNGDGWQVGGNNVGDIADFSSYATADRSPTGLQYPWITAPGAQIVAAVNHNSSEYISGDSETYRVNANTTYPYGIMQGTSMATPMAAGIVALWLQVAKENNIELTLSDIKTVMKESAIKDSYVTSGSNRTHFGNGKIDALAGIKYILDNYASNDPVINVNPLEVTFNGTLVNQSEAQTLAVTGRNLTGNITVTKGGTNAAMFTVSPTSLTSAGGDITVTYSPTAVGEHTATITLSSTGAEPIVVNVTGTSTFSKSLPVLAEASNVGDTQFTATWTDATNAQYVSSYDLDVMIAGGSTPTTTVSDELTRSTTGVTGTNYTSWTAIGTSGAVYAGQSAGGNEAIQLRTTNSNSGIVTTTSGGKIKKVTVSWTNTSGRTLNVYGSNTAYSSPSDLYGSNAGTLIGTIDSDSGTELAISGDYAYVGVRSASGALWMNSITFDWETSGASSAPRRASEEGGLTHRSITGITAKTYTVTDLKQAETFNYKVRANYVDQTQSEWTATKQVTLTGEKILYPEIVVDPETLDLGTITTGSSATATFDVLASELKDDVTVAVTGTGFSVNPTTIAKAEALEGATVTVTFAPTAAGTFEGTVTVSSEDAEDVTVSLTGVGTLLKEVPVLTDATNVGSTSFTANWNTVANALSYTLFVCKQAAATTVSDVLNRATTGVTGSSYSTWSNVSVTSDAVYAGQSAGGNESIQLKSKDSTSGIVTTTSGGKIKKVTVDWNENTSGRTLDVYGSNTAYTAASNLYSSSTQGTKLGSISSDSDTELEISGDYAYVGVRSNSGALYMNSITFDWETSGASGAPRRAVSTSGDADNGGLTVEGIEGGTYTVEGLTAGATYDYKVKVVYTDNTESDWSASRSQQLLDGPASPELTVTPASLTFDETYVGETATKTFTVTGSNLTEGVNIAVTGTGFSVNPTTLTAAQAAEGATVTVTFAPTTTGSFTGTVTITSAGAESKTVALSGTAANAPLVVYDPVMQDADANYVTTNSFKAEWTDATPAENVASYTLYVNKKTTVVTNVSDELTLATTGRPESSTYGNWSGKTVTSNAVYAGNSAGDHSSIQLRSNNSNSGIVTTTTGGKIRKVTIDWNSNTSSGRTLDVYGSNTAYTDATELYGSALVGTKLGSIVCGTSTELEISGDYAYVGVRSNSNAMYLNSITFEWQPVTGSGAPRRATETGDADDDGLTVTGITAKEYTVTGLTAGATYEYNVKAIYTDESESSVSNTKEVTLLDTPPTPTPELTVTPASLTFDEITEGETTTKTFTVTGANLEGDVTLSVDNQVFSLSQATIAQVTAEAGDVTVTVTFSPSEAGNYTGTVTVASTGATSKTVELSAAATERVFEAPELTPPATDDIASEGFTARWGAVDGAVSYTLQVTKTGSAPGPTIIKSDVLTRATTGVTGTGYTSWSEKTGVSGAVYAGQSAGGNDAIQLRTDNSNSGIVTTTSGGKIKKVTVVWQSSTSSGRTLNVYGKNTAYSDPTDLYSSSSQGDLLGTIVYGTSTELEITGDYTYVGVRSANKPMYLTSITFDWEQASSSSAPRRTPVEEGDDQNRTITGITETSYSVGGLEENATFEYKVKAVFEDGESDWSESRTVDLSTSDPTGIEMLKLGEGVTLNGRTLMGDASTRVFTISGIELPARDGQWTLDRGIYVVQRDGKALKLVVR